MVIASQVKVLEELAAQLVKAATIREKVRLADRIFAALSECEKRVEQFIVGGMTTGIVEPQKPPVVKQQEPSKSTKNRFIGNKQFVDMPLADIARELLSGFESMHGLEIERLAKAGGFKSDAKHFQSYLAVALKRKGGFENIGKNTWRLNDEVAPEDRERGITVERDPKSATIPRKTQLHNWLRENGPAHGKRLLADLACRREAPVAS